ncbi:hypothetical protein VE02_09582 [Pseudogymnoascus sp. 03VT05]|nr:hypothetical protein VE02_09582 [Pseudogymnoascus sp. 03VT05]
MSTPSIRSVSRLAFVFISLLSYGFFVSGFTQEKHNHAHHLHHRASGIHNGTVGTATAEEIVQRALAALAVANKKRLQHTHFNRHEFLNASILLEPNVLAPPLDYSGGNSPNSTDIHRKRSASTNSTKSSSSISSYSLPAELIEAARIVAGSPSEQTQTSAGNHSEVAAKLKLQFSRNVTDTNTPPQALLLPDGLTSFVEVEPQVLVSSTTNDSTSSHEKRAAATYWMASVDQNGISPFAPAGYKVWRNVKDFGAVGNGIADDTAAINLAISSGGRCGAGCGSSTIYPAVVWFPSGTYLISSSIIQYYNTQFLGDPLNVPTILAASSFVGLGVITSDVYTGVGEEEWYINQNNFLRSVKNFRIDITRTDPAASVCGIHWQVAQGTSLENIDFYMSYAPGNTQQGIFMENGSGGFLSDLTFIGGNFGAYFGNQQFTTHHLVFSGCVTALQIHWDWAWEMQDIVIQDCGTGIIVVGGAGGVGSTSQGVGSFLLVDALISNTPRGIVTSLFNENSTSLLLQNVGFTSVSVPIQDVQLSKILLAGPNVALESWGFGKLVTTTGSAFMNGQNIPVMARAVSLVGSSGYNGKKNFYIRSRPKYDNIGMSQILNVKSSGARGDGVSDDTAALNSIFAIAANMSSIVFVPFGVYIITDTLYIPLGSRIVGQAWSQIMATGPQFQDASNPHVAIQVGSQGDVGVIEIQDMLFTVSGKTAGAVLVEWNVHESTQGSAGLWDSHIRIGGAIGSNLQKTQCPKLTGSVNSNCIAASLLLHLTPQSSAYMSNVWTWVADHDLDIKTQDQIDIYSARGILIESQGPTWLYGTASEHSVMYQYQLSGAKNILLAGVQTESPYYQVAPRAPEPFGLANSAFPNDPTFGDCSASSTTCAVSWAVRVIDSSTIYMLSAGLYSWFSKYSQDCLLTESCQDRSLQIENSDDIWIYNLATKAIKEMVSPTGETPTYASQNQNGYLSSVMGWVRAANTTIGKRTFTGFQIYELDWLSSLSELPNGCKTALTQVIKCHSRIQEWGEPQYRGNLFNKTLTDSICDATCGASLKSWFDNTQIACKGYNAFDAVSTKVGGIMWQGYNETCVKDAATGAYCNDIISQFTTVDEVEQMPTSELCSYCFVKKFQMMQASSYSGYDATLQRTMNTILTKCNLNGQSNISPSLIVRPPPEPAICPSDKYYTTKADDTCDSISLSTSVSSASLFIGNTGTLHDCKAMQAGTKLCLPFPCETSYKLQSDDTCLSIEMKFNMTSGGLRALNPYILYSCDNLHTGSNVYGSILCASPQASTFNFTEPVLGVNLEPGVTMGYSAIFESPPANSTVAVATTLQCGKWHKATEGETCAGICVQELTLSSIFLAANPSLSSVDCTKSLVVGLTYCAGPLYGWETAPDRGASLGPTGWASIGCYYDNSTARSLTNPRYNDLTRNIMTPKMCQDTCASEGYTLAGIENGGQCFCDNEVRNGGHPATDNVNRCYTPCTGDPTQACGGPDRLNVYQSSHWVPIGCYTDVATARSLSKALYNDATRWSMTTRLCQATCSQADYTLAGIEYGGQCYCDNQVRNAGHLATDAVSLCNMPCSGDSTQTCGGPDRLTMYKLASWVPFGCYTDSTTTRSLANALYNDSTRWSMTTELCQATCGKAGYSLAGIEYGGQCYCDNQVRNAGRLEIDHVSLCNMPCSGDSTQICGGPDRLTMYKLRSA